jgi:hypothetical protein
MVVSLLRMSVLTIRFSNGRCGSLSKMSIPPECRDSERPKVERRAKRERERETGGEEHLVEKLHDGPVSQEGLVDDGVANELNRRYLSRRGQAATHQLGSGVQRRDVQARQLLHQVSKPGGGVRGELGSVRGGEGREDGRAFMYVENWVSKAVASEAQYITPVLAS